MPWTAEQQRTYMKEYRARNGEKMNAQSRAWYHANKDRVHKQRVVWAEKNRVELNAYKKAWRIAHPESTATTKAKRKEVDHQLKRNHFYKYRSHYIWNNIRKRATATGRPFNLSKEMVAEMLAEASTCPVLSVQLEHAAGRVKDNSPTVDCFHPGLGYVPGNVHVISWRANRLKSDATLAEIQAIAAWMEATTVIIQERAA